VAVFEAEADTPRTASPRPDGPDAAPDEPDEPTTGPDPEPVAGAPAPATGRWRRWYAGLRPRLLVWFLGLAGLALAIIVFTSHQLLDAALTERVDLGLRREAARFELASAALSPEAADADAELTNFLRSYLASAPVDDEQALLVLVDGRPVGISADAAYRLDELDDAVASWGQAAESRFGSVDTPAGEFRYLVVPLQVGELRGALVTGEFTEAARESVDDATWRLAGMSLLVLAAAAVVAWSTASRALRPVHRLASTARRVSASDLSARIDVDGHDEMAEMAETFNEMLDRLERALSSQRQLLRDVGHELRTPLTVVRGHLEQLDDDPARRDETIALLLAELDRMATLVTDLRTLAQSERADFLRRQPVDAGELVRDAASLASVLAEREWVVGPVDEAVVEGDRERLLQVLLALVQNAVDATDEGDRIELGSERVGDHMVFRVRDSGPGVPPADQQRIFERFARGATARPGGSGLGLSIVAAIAKAHGGTAWVESDHGSGATFFVSVADRR
jgi:signal transduction histidine kinase